jgi:putative ABC transport system permease protein
VLPEKRGVTVDLVRQFASVSALDIGAVRDQVRRSMGRAVLAVQYVFVFTLAAVGAALIGYVLAT